MKKSVNILNTSLNNNKKLYYQIQKIYGLGSSTALKVCNQFGISKNVIINNIKPNVLLNIENFLSTNKEILLVADLHKFEFENVKNLKNIKSYRGFRHLYNLSVRGQRTKTNCKTQKNRHRRKKK